MLLALWSHNTPHVLLLINVASPPFQEQPEAIMPHAVNTY